MPTAQTPRPADHPRPLGVTPEVAAPRTDRIPDRPAHLECPTCVACVGKMHPSHDGSRYCESGSIASGGTKTHCTCDVCF